MGDVLACQPRGPEFKSPNAGFVFNVATSLCGRSHPIKILTNKSM